MSLNHLVTNAVIHGLLVLLPRQVLEIHAALQEHQLVLQAKVASLPFLWVKFAGMPDLKAKVAGLPYLQVKFAGLPDLQAKVAALPYLQHFLETSMLELAQITNLEFPPFRAPVHGGEPTPGFVLLGWVTQHGHVPVHKRSSATTKVGIFLALEQACMVRPLVVC